MPDSRPSGLSEVLSAELAALYDSLVIPVDDPSYSAGDVKKIKAKTLLKAVNDAIATINTTLGTKANADNVLLKNNTAEYIPSGDYNPATRKLVYDNAKLMLIGKVSDASSGFTFEKYKGSLTMTATRLGNGYYRVTHNKGDTNYIVSLNTLPRGTVLDIVVTSYVPTSNYFEFRTKKDTSAYDGIVTFRMEAF